jgi:hypothetical protein
VSQVVADCELMFAHLRQIVPTECRNVCQSTPVIPIRLNGLCT